jgi:thiosulfate/3-mercaptopyruvate sulfurtransferase
MMNVRNVLTVGSALATSIFLATAVTPSSRYLFLVAASAEAVPAFPSGQSGPASSLPADVEVSTDDLAKLLRAPATQRPMTVQVGFYVLYAQAHIPGSEYAGPASQPDGLEKLRKRVESLPRSKFIVLYCGCCPWIHCPTLKPAYEALHNMGFTRLKVLYIPNNFGQDWVNKGFPVEKG